MNKYTESYKHLASIQYGFQNSYYGLHYDDPNSDTHNMLMVDLENIKELIDMFTELSRIEEHLKRFQK